MVIMVPFIVTMVFIFGTYQSAADPLRNEAAKTIFTLLFSNWDGLVTKYRISWVRNLSYLFRSPVNFSGKLIFNMGSWETDARAGTGSAPAGAVTVAIVTAGDEGGPEGPR